MAVLETEQSSKKAITKISGFGLLHIAFYCNSKKLNCYPHGPFAYCRYTRANAKSTLNSNQSFIHPIHLT